MEKRITERSELVRCLDCGTKYVLPRDNRAEAMPCPACGGVGWVAAASFTPSQPRNS